MRIPVLASLYMMLTVGRRDFVSSDGEVQNVSTNIIKRVEPMTILTGGVHPHTTYISIHIEKI